MPSSIAIRRAARSDGTFPYPLSSTAAALIPGPYEMVPGYAPGGASAVVSFPQHRHSSDGSSHSVTRRVIFTSQTCAHDAPASAHPGQAAPHPEHSAGGPPSPLVRITVPGQARAGVPGLPAALAVLAPLPLRGIPVPALGLAALFGPDRLLRTGRPGIGAVHAQAAFQFGDPQLQPAFPVQRRRQLRPQHRDLGVLRLHHSPQPGQQLTLLPGRQIGRIGHKPQACSTSTATSSTRYSVSRNTLTPRPPDAPPEWNSPNAQTQVISGLTPARPFRDE